MVAAFLWGGGWLPVAVAAHPLAPWLMACMRDVDVSNPAHPQTHTNTLLPLHLLPCRQFADKSTGEVVMVFLEPLKKGENSLAAVSKVLRREGLGQVACF